MKLELVAGIVLALSFIGNARPLEPALRINIYLCFAKFPKGENSVTHNSVQSSKATNEKATHA